MNRKWTGNARALALRRDARGNVRWGWIKLMASKKVRAATALGVLAVALTGAFSPAAAGITFPAAVEQILRNQTTGPVSRLPADKKTQLIGCVNQVLADLPNGKKRFVIQAANFDELEDRFGKVVMENQAEWKQKIARGCAHIVV
jgi:hypothetical protein